MDLPPRDEGAMRGLMNNGNYSVTFMPLIAVMATIVPRFLSRIKQMRPTQTVSGRDLRAGRAYLKEMIDQDLCNDLHFTESHSILVQYPRVFYTCSLNKASQRCLMTHKATSVERGLDPYEKYLLGRLAGKNGCVYIKLYHCPSLGQLQPRPCQPPNAMSSDLSHDHLTPHDSRLTRPSTYPQPSRPNQLSTQHNYISPHHDPSHPTTNHGPDHFSPHHDPNHLSPVRSTNHISRPFLPHQKFRYNSSTSSNSLDSEVPS